MYRRGKYIDFLVYMTDEVSTVNILNILDMTKRYRRQDGVSTLIFFFKIDSYSHRQVDVKMFFSCFNSLLYIVIC